MSDSLPIWRVFNYLAKTWYDMPTRELDGWHKWYVPAIDLVWSMANAQEIERREAAGVPLAFQPKSVAALLAGAVNRVPVVRLGVTDGKA